MCTPTSKSESTSLLAVHIGLHKLTPFGPPKPLTRDLVLAILPQMRPKNSTGSAANTWGVLQAPKVRSLRWTALSFKGQLPYRFEASCRLLTASGWLLSTSSGRSTARVEPAELCEAKSDRDAVAGGTLRPASLHTFRGLPSSTGQACACPIPRKVCFILPVDLLFSSNGPLGRPNLRPEDRPLTYLSRRQQGPWGHTSKELPLQ